MDDDLQYLVHFFDAREHLFETITMAEASQVDDICNTISSRRGWFWMRFSRGERAGYLRRRSFVERAMYDDYVREYGSLKERVPVYFYLVPKITDQKAAEMARQRTRHGEAEAQVLMARLADVEDTSNMTFTLNDSHTAYWRRMKEAGVDFGGERNVPVVLPDHNRIFPLSMVERIHREYRARVLHYEVQVWDRQLLENLRYTILRGNEAERGQGRVR